jgi:tetratricopeptide (TPR) repeat protein
MGVSNIVLFVFASGCLITALVSHLSNRDKPTWFIFIIAILFSTLGAIDLQKLANIKFNAFEGVSFEVALASPEKIIAATEISKDETVLSDTEIKQVIESSKNIPERQRTDADYLILAKDASISNNYDDELRYIILGLERPSSNNQIKASLITRYAGVLGEFEANDKAILMYKKAILIDPSYLWPHFKLGSFLEKLGRFDEALKAFDEAIRIAPKEAFYFAKRGILLMQLGRFDEALKAFDEAIRIDPKEVQYHVNRGGLLEKLGRLEEALKAFDEAIRIDPKEVLYYAKRGILLMQLGRFDEALKAFDEVIRIDPKDINGQYYRDFLLETMREKD